MEKEEKIVIACFLIVFFSMATSYIYTCYKIKPSDKAFKIETLFKTDKFNLKQIFMNFCNKLSKF